MAKDKITDYSATNASNTDVGNINIDEGCDPPNINNAIREVMTHLKETSAGTYPVEDTWSFADPADLTKKFRFDGGSITTGNTRVLTVPDFDGTLATLAGTETLSNKTNRAADGTNGAPSYSFANDTDSGFRLPSAGAVSCVIGGSEVWRQSASDFLVGKAASSAATAGVELATSGNVTVTRDGNSCVTLRRLSDNGGIQLFQQAASAVGSISVTGSATAYNTSSDERLKNFTGEYSPDDAIAIIKADPVRRFEWKSTGEKAIGWGAQTSHKVSPDLATPGKGKPGSKKFEPWGVDPAKRTPYLWAAFAGMIARIEELERKVEELSND